MVRAPCCEKMGLKKGPWTPQEDMILVAYIKRYGHGNWRALPKQAGLLRCGKSCRLRWTNYLRPDIKRGNFSKEEEEAIINLHETLGNRWSAIAARLPGRTDNEIKNVWHTHLKKRLKPDHRVEESKRKAQSEAKTEIKSKPITLQTISTSDPSFKNPVSPEWSYSNISCSGTDSSIATGENNNVGIKEECMASSQEFLEIDESFWSDALSMENCNALMEVPGLEGPHSGPIGEPLCSFDSSDDADMNFWLKIFMEAGDLQDLPEI